MEAAFALVPGHLAQLQTAWLFGDSERCLRHLHISFTVVMFDIFCFGALISRESLKRFTKTATFSNFFFWFRKFSARGKVLKGCQKLKLKNVHLLAKIFVVAFYKAVFLQAVKVCLFYISQRWKSLCPHGEWGFTPFM